jgi:hypothetical protein
MYELVSFKVSVVSLGMKFKETLAVMPELNG